MTTVKSDLFEQWKEAAKRDDVLNRMVPSDVRQLVGEIERLRAQLAAVTKIVEAAQKAVPEKIGDQTELAGGTVVYCDQGELRTALDAYKAGEK